MSYVPRQEAPAPDGEAVLWGPTILLPVGPDEVGASSPGLRHAMWWHAAVSLSMSALDAIAVTSAWVLTLLVAMSDPPAELSTQLLVLAAGAVVPLLWSPRSPVRALRTVETGRLIVISLVTGAWATVANIVMGLGLGPLSLSIGTVATLLLLLLGREVGRSIRSSLRARGRLVNPTLLVAGDGTAAGLHRLLREHDDLGLDLVGRVGGPVASDADLLEVPWLGPVEDLTTVIAERGVRDVFIASSGIEMQELNDLVRRLESTGVDVHVSSGLQGLGSNRLSLSPVALEPLLRLVPHRAPRWQLMAKRAMDVSVASVVLLVSLPMIALAAVLIKRQDGGPVLFRQMRVGQDGQPFMLYKLRTMVQDAEDHLDRLRAHNERDGGPLFKMDDDPRVTRLGQILRRTSVDELPQLVNVLRGEMALVGPRPALPAEASAFSPRLQERCRVKPGMTGLWQVEARHSPSFWSYERLDLYYVENWTIALDLAILLATAPIVIRPAVSGVWCVLRRICDGLGPTSDPQGRRSADAHRSEPSFEPVPLPVGPPPTGHGGAHRLQDPRMNGERPSPPLVTPGPSRTPRSGR